MSADCCTALSTVFALFLRRGTRAAQPAIADVPDKCIYYVTDELLTEQAVSGSWVNYTDGPGFDPALLFGSYLLQGARASQPAAGAVPEFALYFVTDESVTEQALAGAWTPYSDTSTLPFAKASATNTTSQSVPSGGPNILAFDTIEFDNAAIFDLGTDDTLATIPETGVYLVMVSFKYDAGYGGAYCDARANLNGTTIIAIDQKNTDDMSFTKHAAALFLATIGDTITLETYNGRGITCNSGSGGGVACRLQLQQVSR